MGCDGLRPEPDGDDRSRRRRREHRVQRDRGAAQTRSGGVCSRGRAWTLFEHDTMRMSTSWTGEGFIDWEGINFNGRHQVHPRVIGIVQAANSSGPGWADPETGSFVDPRPLGRDGRQYGPLPRRWAQYRGLYHNGNRSSCRTRSEPHRSSKHRGWKPCCIRDADLHANARAVGPASAIWCYKSLACQQGHRRCAP